MDKLQNIAKTLIDYSLEVADNETLYIEIIGKAQLELATVAEKYATSKGIKVISKYQTVQDFDNFWECVTPARLEELIDEEMKLVGQADKVLQIKEDGKLVMTKEQKKLFSQYYNVVQREIRQRKRRCLTEIPNVDNYLDENAYKKAVQTYYDSCLINYYKLDEMSDSLVKYLQKSDKVHIVSQNTDLTFSIKNLPPIKCVGKRNFPDGEVYTAPVKDSVNGFITYNVASTENGVTHSNIRFEFKNGKIIKATSDNTEELNKVLDTDDGARYIGEFSFGLNPLIKTPQNSILYDEKISGSFHLTPGRCYDVCDNGNYSAIHWDLVQIQTPEYGGGEIWIDDVLVRKDGKFIPRELVCLNAENLIKGIK